MKAVMLSIQPKWCELIASAKKTIEVRKTRPKLETPFKCYIYCTKGGRPLVYAEPSPICTEPILHRTYGWNRKDADKTFGIWNGKAIGEFVCDKIDTYSYHKGLTRFGGELGLPIGTYDSYLIFDDDYKAMCLTYDEVKGYGKSKTLYGWHISDLKIYDAPKELSEFYSLSYQKNCKPCDALCEYYPDCVLKKNRKTLARPFQSWGYIEEPSK